MTTLPQTTTVRVPRTTGPSTLMIPGMGIPTAQMQSMGGQMSGADVWRVIRANMMLIISSIVVFAVLGVAAYFWLGKYYPRFTSVGYIEVQPTNVIDPLVQAAPPDRNAIELEQRSQATLLRHEALLSAVLTRSADLRATSWFQQFKGDVRAAKEDLLDRLSITPVVDTKLIQISVSYSDPKDSTTMVQELVDQHLRQQGELRRDNQLRRSQALNEIKKVNQLRLNDLNEQLRQKGGKLAVDNLGVPGHLNNKETEASQLVIRLVEQTSRLEAAKSMFAAPPTPWRAHRQEGE